GGVGIRAALEDGVPGGGKVARDRGRDAREHRGNGWATARPREAGARKSGTVEESQAARARALGEEREIGWRLKPSVGQFVEVGLVFERDCAAVVEVRQDELGHREGERSVEHAAESWCVEV